LKLSDHAKGTGIWKFNNSLLKDETYNEEIKQIINDTLNQYRDRSNWSPILNFWFFKFVSGKFVFEMIKLEIRGKTIKLHTLQPKRNI
jgi:hypothetical protein